MVFFNNFDNVIMTNMKIRASYNDEYEDMCVISMQYVFINYFS